MKKLTLEEYDKMTTLKYKAEGAHEAAFDLEKYLTFQEIIDYNALMERYLKVGIRARRSKK